MTPLSVPLGSPRGMGRRAHSFSDPHNVRLDRLSLDGFIIAIQNSVDALFGDRGHEQLIPVRKFGQAHEAFIDRDDIPLWNVPDPMLGEESRTSPL